MIIEFADIRIRPGQNAAFEEAVTRGIDTVGARAKGFQGYKINRGVESPERYILQIFWNTLEDHAVTFPLAASRKVSNGPDSVHVHLSGTNDDRLCLAKNFR